MKTRRKQRRFEKKWPTPVHLQRAIQAARFSYYERSPLGRLKRASDAIRAGAPVDKPDRQLVSDALDTLYAKESVLNRRGLRRRRLQIDFANYLANTLHITREEAAHLVARDSKDVSAIVRSIANLRAGPRRRKK
jgi:hypothetical protein